MRLLLIGPPGSGKGTQAVHLAEHYGIAHISSGDLLRRHVAENTTIGRSVAACIQRGDLVPDGIVMDILRKPVEAATRRGGYILDGFPRTVEQAETAYRVAEPLGTEVRIAVHLTAARPELIRRLLDRGAQTGRTDDTEHVIGHRLDVFDQAATPLLDYYRKRQTLITIDGDRPVSEVTRTAITHLDQARHDLGLPEHRYTPPPAAHRDTELTTAVATPGQPTPQPHRNRQNTGPGRK
ncbi:adenylate kinase [Actinoplanes awajinensis]|uniref:adenylate kinase n=1 Tax=Actinoplanes awajinensis TaxID=135946 RepID=UPI000829AC1C|nr:adenylate kinase [Actinoplanes awajinensis]